MFPEDSEVGVGRRVERRRAREEEVVVFPTPPLPVRNINFGVVWEGRSSILFKKGDVDVEVVGVGVFEYRRVVVCVLYRNEYCLLYLVEECRGSLCVRQLFSTPIVHIVDICRGLYWCGVLTNE